MSQTATETKTPFLCECALCDNQVADPTTALLQGWSNVEPIKDEFPALKEDGLTHVGCCPACVDESVVIRN